MFGIEVLAAVFLAMLFSYLLLIPLGRTAPGPLAGWLFVALILFLSILAFGGLMRPMAPQVGGFSWLGFLLAAVVVALLFAAILPPRRAAEVEPIPPPAAETEATAATAALGVFFYALIFVLLVVVVVRLFVP